MLTYDIAIQGNAEGEVFYGITFQNGKRSQPEKFNSAQVDFIYSTVEKLVDALKAISDAQE